MKFIFATIVLFISIYGCSLNPNSKIWTTTTKISSDENLKIKYITKKKEILNKELNVGLQINLKNLIKDSTNPSNLTNNIYSKFEGQLKNKSKYKYSKIKKFDQYEPEISFIDDGIIFFNNKGSILKFNRNSNLIWKKNYYKKKK